MPDFSNAENSAAKASDVAAEKTALRTTLIVSRQALSDDARRTAATRVRVVLRELIEAESPVTVTAYVPVGDEPGGADLPEALARMLWSTGRLLLPVLRPDFDLDWAEYAGPASLTSTMRGLREPTGRRRSPAAIGLADLLIVPALAVDRHGVRLGRGGGSYDRALSRCRDALVIALLHDGELIDRVPEAAHDRRVNGVITPTAGLVRLPAA